MRDKCPSEAVISIKIYFAVCEMSANDIEEFRNQLAQARKAINNFGNDPRGFDWGVLGRIDDLEEENKRLRARIEKFCNAKVWCIEDDGTESWAWGADKLNRLAAEAGKGGG